MKDKKPVGRPTLTEDQKKKSVAKTITFQPETIVILKKHYPFEPWSVVVNRLLREKHN